MDALQNLAIFENGLIRIRNMEYKILLIPNIEYMPLETMKAVEDYVRGGGIIIALDRLPAYSTGLAGSESNNQALQKIVRLMFRDLNGKDLRAVNHGDGWVHFLKKVIHREIWWDQYSSPLDPFLKIIKKYIRPDFGIDFAHEGIRKNKGLTFLHRKLPDADIYFVSNIQDRPSEVPVTFRVRNRTVWNWDPYTGKTSQVFLYNDNESGIIVPLKLSPWESTILIFEQGNDVTHVEETDFSGILAVSNSSLQAVATENGVFHTTILRDGAVTGITSSIHGLPSPLCISGSWQLTLESEHFEKTERELFLLRSWTDDPGTRHFSGTGRYEILFDMPGNNLEKLSHFHG